MAIRTRSVDGFRNMPWPLHMTVVSVDCPGFLHCINWSLIDQPWEKAKQKLKRKKSVCAREPKGPQRPKNNERRDLLQCVLTMLPLVMPRQKNNERLERLRHIMPKSVHATGTRTDGHGSSSANGKACQRAWLLARLRTVPVVYRYTKRYSGLAVPVESFFFTHVNCQLIH